MQRISRHFLEGTHYSISMSVKRVRGASIVGNLVFTSGRSGGKGDVETQIRNSLKRLEEALKEAGTTLDHVVKATVYLADLGDRPKYLNPIWADTFKENRPARTCIQAYLGEGVAVEIEFIAVIP